MFPLCHLERSVINRFFRISCIFFSVFFYIIFSCRTECCHSSHTKEVCSRMCKFDNNCLVIWCRYAKFIDRHRTAIYFCTVFEDISDECVIACHFWIHKSLDTINIIACFYIFSVRPFQSITKVECVSKSVI